MMCTTTRGRMWENSQHTEKCAFDGVVHLGCFEHCHSYSGTDRTPALRHFEKEGVCPLLRV